MGKHEPMTAKAIANKIKAKGLQKIKYYCEMCKKQCRDDNGFKCHIMSESHQRQALIVSENPEQFVGEFSKQFMDGFMFILRTRYKSKRILANTVFQEYIKDREHIHMNGTRWTSLTEFANWLGENGHVEVDESERGVMVTYIDRDPETLRRQELEVKRAEQAKEAAIRSGKEIERQREATKRLYEQLKKDKPAPEPVPIVRIEVKPDKSVVEKEDDDDDNDNKSIEDQTCESETKTSESDTPNAAGTNEEDKSQIQVIERPMFGVGAISLKTTAHSSYKRPPPKTKLVRKTDSKKKLKSS